MDVYFDDLKVTHELSDIVAGADYYPFGLKMDGREITREDFRFGYQGQFAEEDEETGWNSFELRMYDPVIGRWMVTDPAGQYYSSYLGMGNNPVSLVDPDGAFSKIGAWWRSKLISGSSTFYHSGEGEWVIQMPQRVGTLGSSDRSVINNYIVEGGPGLGKDFMTFDGVATLGISGTASPGIGGSFEVGFAVEHKPEYFKIRPYLTLEQTWGGDLSGGLILNYHKPNKGTISISDIEGWSESWNGGVWIIDGTYGGNSLNSGLNPNAYSDQHNKYHTYGIGLSAGTPVGFTKNKGYTWTYFND